MLIRFAVSIAHAAHVPERKASLTRMLAALGDAGRGFDDPRVACRHLESLPGKPHEWSERQWRGAYMPNATHALFLNDDLVPCAGFWDALTQAVAARPREIVSLYASARASAKAHADGAAWVTSADGLIGNAYVIPMLELGEFLAWRRKILLPGTIERLSEDQLINLFAMATGRRVWHTVPSLVAHDTTVASLFGNRHVPALPPGTAEEMAAIDWSRVGPHAGRQFHGNHRALLTFIKPEAWAQYDCVRRYYAIEADRTVFP